MFGFNPLQCVALVGFVLTLFGCIIIITYNINKNKQK